jgi:hypothetical protein
MSETALVQRDPNYLIQLALEKGIPPGELFEMEARWTARIAAEGFADAIASFQAVCPMIQKTREVKGKSQGNGPAPTKYKFASYEDILAVVGPLLTERKIAHSFSCPPTAEGQFVIVCHLRVGSHAEDRPFACKAPNILELAKATYCNEAQAVGVWRQYMKRYAFTDALGIVVCDEDTDAATVLRSVDAEQITTIKNYINDINDVYGRTGQEPFKMGDFLDWIQPGLSRVEDCPASEYQRATKELGRIYKLLMKGGVKK